MSKDSEVIELTPTITISLADYNALMNDRLVAVRLEERLHRARVTYRMAAMHMVTADSKEEFHDRVRSMREAFDRADAEMGFQTREG